MKALLHRITATLLAVFIIAPLGAAEPTAPPAGIRTDFGDVQIDNLGIGRTYSLRDLAGVPLKVTNNGAETVNLSISVEVPDKTMITEIRKGLGYKPVPNTEWVTLSQSQFIVPSGESAYTDIVIKIPDDPSLYGKKFQASIYSRTTGAAFLNIGVWSHLQIGIIPSPEAQAALEKNRRRGTESQLDYSLMPDKLYVEKVPLGKKVNVREFTKRSIMIANSGADSINLSVKVMTVGATPLTLQTGFEEGKTEWLSVKNAIIDVDGASFSDPGYVLNLPNDKSLAGKKFMWAIQVAPTSKDAVGVTYYGRIYAEVLP